MKNPIVIIVIMTIMFKQGVFADHSGGFRTAPPALHKISK